MPWLRNSETGVTVHVADAKVETMGPAWEPADIAAAKPSSEESSSGEGRSGRRRAAKKSTSGTDS